MGKIRHIAIRCEDTEKTAAWLTGALELQLVQRRGSGAIDLTDGDVNITLLPLEVNAANDQEFIKKDFDLGFASYCNGPDPEIGVRRMYVSTNIGPILFSNGAGYRNPQVDQLFDQAAAGVERADRARAYYQIQDIAARDLPYLPIVETAGYRAWRSSLHNLFNWSGNLAEAAWTDQQ